MKNIAAPHLSTSGGFTIIELLVVIVLIGLLVGSAVAGYNKFNDRQIAFQSARDFIGVLRTAQKRASVGDKPAGCDKLRAYQVTGAAGATYALSAICDGGPIAVQTFTTKGDVVLRYAVDIQFKVLTGAPSPIEADGTNDYYVGTADPGYVNVKVTSGGTISSEADLVTE